MEKFTKSILNYFATYTETRFRFDTKIGYKWTDDLFTADLSVFPDFQKKILNSIKEKDVLDISVKKGQYSVSIDEDDFKKELFQRLDSHYNLDFLKNCIELTRNKLKKTESDKLIVSGEGKNQDTQGQIKPNKEFETRVLHEGIRQFNLAFRKAVQDSLIKLQEEKKKDLLKELKDTAVPSTSFNPNIIEQEIYDTLQGIAHNAPDEISFYKQIKEMFNNKSFEITMFDLYATIRKFITFIRMDTPYIFFHEIYSADTESGPTEKYPILLIEIDLQEKSDEVILKCTRNILLINTPAINSFGFDNILTIPRAVGLAEAKEYLWGVEKFLQNSYNFFDPFLLEYAFKPIRIPNRPLINYRIGLQVVQKENRRLFDYSELITRIDAGKGGKFIDFIKDYVSGNVKNTADEVDSEYNKRYPRKSANNLLSTIPLSLNKPQKRILTAIENPQNKIIVVDGPPGTGKSYTIAAITYWANQQNKSVVITSHKKAALDVIDNMLTENFRRLHPKAKPSVMRISENDRGINTSQNTLSSPVITAANNRANEFNEEAVKSDIENWRKDVESQVNIFWDNSRKYKEAIDKLFILEQIENELKQNGILNEEMIIPKIDKEKTLDINLIKECIEHIGRSQIDKLSSEQLSLLYERRTSLNNLLSVCNFINNASLHFSHLISLKKLNIETLEEFIENLSQISSFLKDTSPVFTDIKNLKLKFYPKLALIFRRKEKLKFLESSLRKLNNLEFENALSNILELYSRERSELTLKDLKDGLQTLKEIENQHDDIELLGSLRQDLELKDKSIKYIFTFLSQAKGIVDSLKPETIASLKTIQEYFSILLDSAGIDLGDLKNTSRALLENRVNNKVLDYIQLFADLSKTDFSGIPDGTLISSYYTSVHKYLEYLNDKRLKNLNNYAGDVERILVTLKNKKRLKINELKILLDNISCIIAEPDLISQYFPMEEDVIDILVIDEASQVSIAESISLILRAKQVVIFGDEWQYGAVSAVNVNTQYANQYFKEILNSYQSDYNLAISDAEKQKIAQEVSQVVDEEEQEVEPIYKPEEGTVDWLKTFSIRTSTLNFAKAIKNYSTSLDTHFRSFSEIIDYSNEFFYKPSQIPLIINRIRTKPINEVLRFIKVETQGNSGTNVNLDEIEAIKRDIQEIVSACPAETGRSNGYKVSIGIITSFREQKYRLEEVLRKELPNYHILERDHKLTVWFVGDVQGEERDIVYYSFVEDKKVGNGSLRNIYPVIGGSADNIRRLKMQRLNVGFSRAKDTMVFVHSMPIEDYSDTRLGDALKHYKHLLEIAKDNFIENEAIFDSPAEQDLYKILINTEFYKKNRDRIKIIAQFPIGKYVEETLQRYIPKYRVDFLVTLSERGKEKSLILEYDGLEYHTKNPEVVTAHNFSQEYLDYDIERQLELESYGYKFLRINKFTLIPKEKGQTKADVLNTLFEKKFYDKG